MAYHLETLSTTLPPDVEQEPTGDEPLAAAPAPITPGSSPDEPVGRYQYISQVEQLAGTDIGRICTLECGHRVTVFGAVQPGGLVWCRECEG